jgi:hypothetical protein
LFVRLPSGISFKKNGKRIDHVKKQEKWSDREQLLFNKDHKGMIDEARRYSIREALSSDPIKQKKARENKIFWIQRAEETTGKRPLYAKHRREISRATWLLQQDRIDRGDPEKYNARLDALHHFDMQAVQSFEKEAHIKALKAKQSAKDWQSLTLNKGPDPARPALETFSDESKAPIVSWKYRSEMDVSPETMSKLDKMINSVDSENRTRASRPKRVDKSASLPSKGHAIQLDRLEKKLKSANEDDQLKWASRVFGVKSNEDPAVHAYEIMHYHNKEQMKRWNQLHWGSVAYHLKKQAASAPVCQ